MAEYEELLSNAALLNRIRMLELQRRLKSDLARQFQTAVVEVVDEESTPPLTTLVEFADWIGRQDTDRIRIDDLMRYAGLVEAAAEKLRKSLDDLLAEAMSLASDAERV
jgi:hypothetical protein